MNKTTDKNNDLIASFMKGTKFLDYELSVHEDYNLMMNVLHKIRKNGCNIKINIGGVTYCIIEDMEFVNTDIISTTFIYNNVNIKIAIYKCIVDYINWYNKNKKR